MLTFDNKCWQKDLAMNDMKGQLTLRGIVVGCIGCVVITAASIYTALKMGALPWPIVFAALISLFFLRALGSRSLNEANVTHTIMSAGAMVAGGLAFTIPGIFILGLGEVEFGPMLLIALAGCLLGLVASAYFRRQFIQEQQLEFPIGRAAAETLKAGDQGGRVGLKLFAAMGFSGLWAVLRDGMHLIPALIFGNMPLAGVTFGVYLSPMMMSVGFLVGSAAMVAWFAGALVQLLLVSGGSALGLYDVVFAQSMNSSLGMGIMMGCGIAVICKDVIPRGLRALKGGFKQGEGAAGKDSEASAGDEEGADAPGMGAAASSLNVTAKAPAQMRLRAGVLALALAAVSYVICVLVGIGPIGSAVVVLLSFAAVAMAAQSLGQTGIDPMEIFGLIVLFLVALIGDTPQVQLFFVAAIIAVACGLGGDVMNDFKAGALLGTSAKAQVVGQAIGGILGAVVAAAALFFLMDAYGPDAFGVGRDFVSAQANVVATLVSGVPCMPAFLAGLALGFIIYCFRGPSMMIGLGVYLPFYMSLTAFLGCVAKWLIDYFRCRRIANLPPEEQVSRRESGEQTGLVIASGLLGGESVVGIVIAIVLVVSQIL